MAEELERRVSAYVEERVAAVLSSDAVQRELRSRLERERQAIEQQVGVEPGTWRLRLWENRGLRFGRGTAGARGVFATGRAGRVGEVQEGVSWRRRGLGS